ncbi:MAG: M3 family oligoendopeptidase [Clostridia bacterium]
MKFTEIPYTRPDMKALTVQFENMLNAFNEAKTFDEADSILLKMENKESYLYTQTGIAYVRHSINTEDKFYEEENDYVDAIMPQCEELLQKKAMALYNSPFKKEFSEKYGDIFFKNIEISLKAFSPEIMPEMVEENKLSSDYDKLIASAQIPFEGKIYTLSQLSPFKQDKDDARRLSAWRAEAGFYVENGEQLDDIYDKLVALRDKMAKKMNYKNFIELGYYRMQRNSYNADDVAKFRTAVIKYIVPVAEKLYMEQAKRTGLPYPLNFSDMALSFRDGNPTPKGTPDDILKAGKNFYHELSPETAEFIDFMFDNELFDVLSRKGKSGGGYCTSFTDYKSPFIFANFNGTKHDVEVITHEAGHAFAAYVSRNMEILELQSPTLESCEVHSMSMEFFAEPWANDFFKEDADKFRYTHLFDAITFIPYGTMVDHFQHSVYERPEMTKKERHDEWRRLLGIYMPWVALGEEIPFYGDGKGWQRQLHIYQSPFYYIDYCLAQSVALQFWAIMQHDQKDAWARYEKFVSFGGTKTFSELIETAGLETPFGDSALKKISDEAVLWLKNNKLSEN